MPESRARAVREIDEVLARLPDDKTLAGRIVRFLIGALVGAILVFAAMFWVSVAADFVPSLRPLDARLRPYFWRSVWSVGAIAGAVCAAAGDRALRAIFLRLRKAESPSL